MEVSSGSLAAALGLLGTGLAIMFPENKWIGLVLIVCAIAALFFDVRLDGAHFQAAVPSKRLAIFGMAIFGAAFLACATWYFWPVALQADSSVQTAQKPLPVPAQPEPRATFEAEGAGSSVKDTGTKVYGNPTTPHMRVTGGARGESVGAVIIGADAQFFPPPTGKFSGKSNAELAAIAAHISAGLRVQQLKQKEEMRLSRGDSAKILTENDQWVGATYPDANELASEIIARTGEKMPTEWNPRAGNIRSGWRSLLYPGTRWRQAEIADFFDFLADKLQH